MDTFPQRAQPIFEPRSQSQKDRDNKTSLQQRPSSERVYFLPTSIQPSTDSGYVAIQATTAAENPRVRVFVDHRLTMNADLAALIQAIDDVSKSDLAAKVEQVAGTVQDVDRDGCLAVVITPELMTLSPTQTPVHGITRPIDFVSGLDRPRSNHSDVIFLSHQLKPGHHLNAVLSHEWCHAAVFSRRCRQIDPNESEKPDDDWLNEAIAHMVEVHASGSMSNLSHRIESFRLHPENSPLVVRDYCRPGYWRHDGCRGAAFSFMAWCRENSSEGFLRRLLTADSLGLEALESATGQSFEELYRGWTAELGRQLLKSSRTHSKSAAASIAHVNWNVRSNPSLTLSIRGSCVRLIRIESQSPECWRLTATGPNLDRLQMTLVQD